MPGRYNQRNWVPAPVTNAKADPRTGLPEYPPDGRSQYLESALTKSSSDFQRATEALTKRLDAMADEFAEAFEAEDKRRSTLARIQNTANPEIDRQHRERMQRLG